MGRHAVPDQRVQVGLRQAAPGADGQLVLQQNYARIGSDEIDQLSDQAAAELDPAKAIQIANEIDAQIWRQVHTLTLYQRPEIVATKANLANFGFGAFRFTSTIMKTSDSS
jgi:ABC-type transport system substrate-binding protein